MNLIALAVSLFVSQTADPWDRAERALASSHGVSALMTVTIGGEQASGRLQLRSPDLVRLRLTGPTVDMEYRQSPRASIYIDHRSRSYQWWPWYPEAMPPPTTPQMLQVAFPQVLMQGSLKSFGPKSGWKTLAREKVGNVDADVISVGPPGGSGTKLWIDDSGHILRQVMSFQQQSGPLTIVSEFQGAAYEALPDSVFGIELPVGYEPEATPRLNDTAVVGQRVKLTTGLRLPEEAPEDLSGLGAVAPVMVVVTSDDLEPSPDAETWPTLAAAAKKKGLAFVQVWVGSKPVFKKTPWSQYWDKDGTLEVRLGPTETPYVYVIEKGTVVSGWQGKIGKRSAEVERALFAPYSKKDD
ncbi:MAG: hypothetical protein JST30_04905 [Armatimonadetes bacterium]|nr:hypothetical protein [Armatimonadota bacterium]